MCGLLCGATAAAAAAAAVKTVPDCPLKYVLYKSDIQLETMNVEQSDGQLLLCCACSVGQ